MFYVFFNYAENCYCLLPVFGTWKMSKEQAVDQCAYFIVRKKRFCRFKPNRDQKYCAEHTGLLGVSITRNIIVEHAKFYLRKMTT